ncbi:hypothetical protein D6827_02015 [Candidatus Parcubacteria bacterium]|nr:MAG: hypothetical protein D6827_02015 [Candidatus Parcubacteria bacterium]
MIIFFWFAMTFSIAVPAARFIVWFRRRRRRWLALAIFIVAVMPDTWALMPPNDFWGWLAAFSGSVVGIGFGTVLHWLTRPMFAD